MGEPEMTTCEQCGAALVDRALHNRWHADIEERIRNVDVNLTDELRALGQRTVAKADFNKLDRSHEGVWPAIDKIRSEAGLPERNSTQS
ncbi:hypothetical protein [Jatrophihabitans fulvus]